LNPAAFDPGKWPVSIGPSIKGWDHNNRPIYQSIGNTLSNTTAWDQELKRLLLSFSTAERHFLDLGQQHTAAV
jgi:hypothetical protein